MKRIHGKGGFSIAELLIALGLTSLVAAASFMVYFAGAKAWKRAENLVEVQQNLRIAMNTLNTEIRKADYFKIQHGNREITISYPNGSTKGYKYHPVSGEIRISESGATVAMHIDDLKFSYRDGLIIIEITTKAMEGVRGEKYTFSIYARGKAEDDRL